MVLFSGQEGASVCSTKFCVSRISLSPSWRSFLPYALYANLEEKRTPEGLRAPVFEYEPYSFASHEEKMPRSARKRRIIMDAILFFFVSKNPCL